MFELDADFQILFGWSIWRQEKVLRLAIGIVEIAGLVILSIDSHKSTFGRMLMVPGLSLK